MVLAHVSKTVSAKFPNAARKAIAGFFFLRFVVPAVTTPHIFGLFKEPANESIQRNLILLSKVLQNLANEVQFGVKEPHMQKLNDFIAENLELIHKFFEEISQPPDSSAPVFQVQIPSNVKTNALLGLHQQIFNSRTKIDTELKDQNQDTTAKKLQEILDNLGEPAVMKKN